MPSNGNYSSAGDFVNSIAASAVASFGEGEGKIPGPLSHVSELVIQRGKNPSYALCVVPLAAMNDDAPSVAGVSGGPVDAIKYQMTARVTGFLDPSGSTSGNGSTMLSGFVTEINSDILKDMAIIKIEDSRWVLEGWKIIGSYWLGAATGAIGTIAYREGVRAHFNDANRPNCIFVGPQPVFCIPFYGLNDEDPPPATDGSNVKACYWTPRTIIQYLQYIATDPAAVAMASAKFPFYTALDSSITWPMGLESAIDDTVVESTGERKAKEMVLDGVDLNSAIDEVLRSAGAYELNIIPGDNAGDGTMQIVRSRYFIAPGAGSSSASTGTNLQRAEIGLAQTVLNQAGVITEGSIRGSARNLFTRSAVGGARVYIEQRIQSGQDNDDGTLAWGWSDEDINNAQDQLLTYLNTDNISLGLPLTLKDAMKALFSQYWRLFSTWIPASDYDFQTGTTQEAFPLCDNVSAGRAVLPYLLTSFLQSSDGAGKFALLNSRRPIRIEVNQTNSDESKWQILPINDGLEIWGDGTISLKGLLEQIASYNGGKIETPLYTVEVKGTAPNIQIEKFQPNRIRMTLAFPCDHRLIQAVKLPSDMTAGVDSFSTTTDDSDVIDFGGPSRMYYADAAVLYAYEERGPTSWPIPQSAPGSMQVDPTPTVIRDDTARCLNHAQRKLGDFGRIDRGGTLSSPNIAITLSPGDMINSLDTISGNSSFPVKACVSSIHYHFENPQKMDINLT